MWLGGRTSHITSAKSGYLWPYVQFPFSNSVYLLPSLRRILHYSFEFWALPPFLLSPSLLPFHLYKTQDLVSKAKTQTALMWALQDNRRYPKCKSAFRRLRGNLPWMTEGAETHATSSREICNPETQGAKLTIDHVQVDLGLWQCHGGV